MTTTFDIRFRRAALPLILIVFVSLSAGVAGAATGPRLHLNALRSCLKRDAGGLVAESGVRSTAYQVFILRDNDVSGLIVLSGSDPQPGYFTRAVTTGRRPIVSQRFANIRIDGYVLHKVGVTPEPRETTAIKELVVRDVRACAAHAR